MPSPYVFDIALNEAIQKLTIKCDCIAPEATHTFFINLVYYIMNIHTNVSYNIPWVNDVPTLEILKYRDHRSINFPDIIATVKDCIDNGPYFILCQSCNGRRDEKLLACNYCKECCEDQLFDCPTCDNHTHRNHRNLCENCENCRDCCECMRCISCARVADSICDNEEYCRECCTCSRMRSISTLPKVWHANKLDEFNIPRTAGVEWEFNECSYDPIYDWVKNWRGMVHRDGSCGWEAVTSPIAGDKIFSCLAELESAFREGNAEIDERCGIHVHVDASDLNWEQMYNLLWTYQLIEPLMYIIGGQHRMEGEYCEAIGPKYKQALLSTLGFPGELDQTKDRKNLICQIASIRSIRNDFSPGFRKKDTGRYRGLNLCPWLAGRAKRKQRTVIERTFDAKLGNKELAIGRGVAGTRKRESIQASDTTVEFRIHENSSDAVEVANWTQLCVSIVDWSANASRAEVLALRTPLQALMTIAPSLKNWVLDHIKKWRKHTRVGSVYKTRIIPRLIQCNTPPRGNWVCIGESSRDE